MKAIYDYAEDSSFLYLLLAAVHVFLAYRLNQEELLAFYPIALIHIQD